MSEQEHQATSDGATTYKRLLGYLKPHIFTFVISIIGFAVFSASQPLLAQLTAYIINAIETNTQQNRLMIFSAIVGIYIFRVIGTFIGNYFIARVSLGVVHSLRTQLFEQLTLAPGEYFDNNSSGHLISRITYNVTQVTEAVTDAVKVLLREGLTVLALFGYLLWLDWRMTMVFIVITPFIGLIVSLAGKRLRRISSNIQVTMGNVTQAASEMINGYKVMRSFGGEHYENRRFAESSRANQKQNLKLVSTASLMTALQQLLIAVAMGGVIYLALSFMNTDNSGDFVAYLIAAGLMPKSVRQLSEINSKIQKGIAAATDIFKQLDVAPELDEGKLKVTRVAGDLRLQGLSFFYNEQEGDVLSDINLDIPAGKTVALVGRSGSGKTTLASLIPRFYHHQQGQILLDGKPLEDYQLHCLRQQIALVNQDVTLFNDSLKNNIAYGDLARYSDEEIRAAAEAAYALEFIDQLPEGMDTMVGEDGTRLSGGQRQRIAIARALLKDAPILIMDEATSALDTQSERKIQAALDKVMENRTTLVIAHRLSTIENADIIVVMDAGRIVEQGSHAELIEKDGAYAQLHALQFSEAG